MAMDDSALGDAFATYCRGELTDPYPVFDRLREEDPVHWSDILGSWLVTRYDDVYRGLSDPRLGNDRIAVYMGALTPENRETYALLGAHVGNWLGFTDPPKHTRLRGLVREYFTPRLAEDMRPRIQAIVDDLLDQAAEKDSIDAIADFAFLLPANVIYDLLGIDGSRREEFKELVDTLVPFPGNLGPTLNEVAPTAHAAAVQIEAFFQDLARERIARPGNDLITRLALLWRDGELAEQEIISLSTFIFVAGHETTVSLIANGLHLLARDGGQRQRLAQDPTLASSAVEEFLRFESPVQISPRLTREDLEISGQAIRSGDAVTLVNSSANRDGRQFPDPDRLDLAREPNRHLAFGWAAHFCLGAPLARIEAQCAMASFVARFPRAQLATADIAWVPNMSIRRPIALPMELRP